LDLNPQGWSGGWPFFRDFDAQQSTSNGRTAAGARFPCGASISFMDLQRIDLKALLDAPREASLDSLLAIFGRWRNDKAHPARWVDVADYAHMSRGAGVMLIGKQGLFGVTRFDPGLGLLYSGRGGYEGPCEKRVLETFRRHLALATALFREPEYPAGLKTLNGSWDLSINDRLDFPNTEETGRLLHPPIRAALDKLFGPGSYELTPESDRQRRYGFTVRTKTIDLDRLLDTAQKALA
jgi:hypothetical protein